MTDMLEKIARAIFADLARQNDEAGEPCFIGDGHQLARAALLAMRDPDEAMAEAGWKSSDGDFISPNDVWPAMIDAILKEGGE